MSEAFVFPNLDGWIDELMSGSPVSAYDWARQQSGDDFAKEWADALDLMTKKGLRQL